MNTRELGEPLTVKQVAVLVGCSVWTVRQRLIPSGLPHFRTRPSGRLTFFREQVVSWVLEQQNQQSRRHF